MAATVGLLAAIGKEPIDEIMDELYQIIAGREAGPPALPTQTEMFGLGSYYRGAYTLHALRQMVGDEFFFRDSTSILLTLSG